MNYSVTRLITFSPTHTSFRVGEAILSGMRAKQQIITDITWQKPEEVYCKTEEPVVFVLPVYGGRIAETALERLVSVRGENTPAVVVVVYGNRDYEDALLELTDWVRTHGFIPVAAAAFIGEHSYSRADRPIAAGRPDAQDCRMAEEFGQKVSQELKNHPLDGLPELKVRGNRPYKSRGPKTPQAPVTLENLCTLCGHCAGICPTAAISIGNEVVSDAEKCIKCCACVKECPQEARVFDTPYTDLLFKNFSARREPELFFL